MKPLLLSLFALHSSLFAHSAAVPLKWTVETSRAVPAQFEAYQGETLALEAALQSYGKPLEAPLNYSLYWQTNGMVSTYWSVPCVATASSPSNVLFATWSPTNDVGAKVYNCFIGQPGTIYHAAFQLRLRPSPGATPNELPLPQKVIDFAKVTVLNPPWSGGGGGGVDTNAVLDIIAPATNRLYKTLTDAMPYGAARPLPKYLHALDFFDSYPDAAAEYYRSRGDGKVDGGCSAVRDGGFLYRNFDFPFDDRAEFVVNMPSGPARFASVGVAQVGTNLTEAIVTSGKPSRWYKALPGATVDGINENGVVAEINVVGGDPEWRSGIPSASQVHPLAAVRWALDNGTSAEMVATNLAARIAFPEGWAQNFHYMVADAEQTWIVENGRAYQTNSPAVMTNFALYDSLHLGDGIERYSILSDGANITNVWYTRAYRPTDYPWFSDLGTNYESIWERWAEKPREAHRGETFGGITWWQSVHTSIYDITNKTMRIAVQETDDWYVFAVPSAGGVSPVAVREIAREEITPATNRLYETLIDSTNRLYETLSDSIAGKLDKAGGTVTTSPGNDTWLTLNNSYGFAGSIGTVNLYGGSWQRLFLGGVTRGKFEVEDWNEYRVGYITMDPYGWFEQGLGDVLDTKRDLTNNVCAASSGFSAWTCDPPLPDGYFIKEEYDPFYGFSLCYICRPDGTEDSAPSGTSDDLLYVKWYGGADYDHDVTATRRRLATEGRTFVTDDFVTNAVAAAISPENTTFSNAVATVARRVTPQPSTTLRVYDEVRGCWWIGRMVNGVINWEVE